MNRDMLLQRMGRRRYPVSICRGVISSDLVVCSLGADVAWAWYLVLNSHRCFEILD
jgi:hypothetical protein